MAGGVLVTGARGFVGRALCREIQTRYPKMKLWPLDLPEWDLREQKTLDAIRAYRPFVVFHLAAHHFIPWCNAHPSETTDLNTTATYQLLQAVGDSAEKIVLASSAAVYGLAESPDTAFSEGDHSPRPVDIYGMSKTWAEIALYAHANRERAGCVAARLFNVVGPAGEDKVPHLHPKIMAAAGQTMTCSLPALREHRDYVHVDDAARSLVDLAERTVRSGFQAVNVCTGVTLTGEEMCSLYDVATIDDPALRRPSAGHLRGSNTLLHQITGRAPTTPWERLLTA